MEALVQTTATMDVILDVENPPSDKCARSPKFMRALSRKFCRLERSGCEEQETDEPQSRVAAKCSQGGASSQLESVKQPLLPNKSLLPLASPAIPSCIAGDNNEMRCKKLNRFTTIHPGKIPLIFATLSSMGTIILIYFTLSIHKSAGVQHGK